MMRLIGATAIGLIVAVVVTVLLVANRIMSLSTILDGWGTGVIFSVGWAAFVQYVVVQRPAKRQLRNAVSIVLAELSSNYVILSHRNAIAVRGLSFEMFDRHGPVVVGALNTQASVAIVALYGILRLPTRYWEYRLTGMGTWMITRHLDQSQHLQAELLDVFLQGIEQLDLSIDPAIAFVRDKFDCIYRV